MTNRIKGQVFKVPAYDRFSRVFFRILLFILVFIVPGKSGAQAELQAWGNMTGIRIQGERMEFETSLRVAGDQWGSVYSTGKERQNPTFYRDSSGQVVNTRLGNISFFETVKDGAPGNAVVTIRSTSLVDTLISGIYFCVSLPLTEYEHGILTVDRNKKTGFTSIQPDDQGNLMKASTRALSISSPNRHLDIRWKDPETIYVRNGGTTENPLVDIYIPIQSGKLTAGQKSEKTFTIQAGGKIDRKDIRMVIDTTNPGREFAGFGGNFRIQNLKNDPQVIDYCLNNMRVAWGRVEMPWRFWQPGKNADPVKAAAEGRLDPHVLRAMEMAQKLQLRGIPVILTAWSAPDWAIIGKPVFSPVHGIWGNPLNPDSVQYSYRSIADYILYLRDRYGVQVQFFSFNESDLGIYVRQTGVEHDQLIKELGKYFISRGLSTKILLGDNSDATTYSFIEPALHDAEAKPFIGAVSFHSWRGWESGLLSRWAAASREINLPLIVGEGSIDAAAWAYPAIFLEQTYTMEEIMLYIRLMDICQPMTILQWQLTSDYSPLTGVGIFGTQGPLRPTQRFWNLKQLASTPKGLKYLPLKGDRTNISCAALGDVASGKYSMHIVNDGAERMVHLSGLPATVHSFKIYATNRSSSMKEGNPIAVKNNKADFILPAGTYITLMSE